jgi:phosphohistidine phosphatase SixA
MKKYLCLALLWLLAWPLQAAELSGILVPKLSGTALLDALHTGGYVIYFRHGLTVRGKETPDENDLSNCQGQRMLSEQGIAQMQTIGEVFVAQKIPLGAVYSSPYCRCRDSARHLSGKDAEINPYLAWPVSITPEQQELFSINLKQMLATAPSPGNNTLLVSHTANLQAAVGLRIKNEGDAYIFKPSGEDSFTYIGHFAPEEWQALSLAAP